jgi:hypothetical protein
LISTSFSIFRLNSFTSHLTDDFHASRRDQSDCGFSQRENSKL